MQKLLRNKRGTSLVEYALIAGLISVVALPALSVVGANILIVWQSVYSAIAAI